MSIFLSPHNDDETLFGAFTLLREKPLVVVVTDGYIQAGRGERVAAMERRFETRQAMDILGCSVLFGGIRDTELTREALERAFKQLYTKDVVYAPKPYPNGNPHHNLVGEVASLFPNVVYYATYFKDNLYEIGDVEVKPTEEELRLKQQALQCYDSQLKLPSTRPHFEAVLNKSEWTYK